MIVHQIKLCCWCVGKMWLYIQADRYFRFLIYTSSYCLSFYTALYHTVSQITWANLDLVPGEPVWWSRHFLAELLLYNTVPCCVTAEVSFFSPRCVFTHRSTVPSCFSVRTYCTAISHKCHQNLPPKFKYYFARFYCIIFL